MSNLSPFCLVVWLAGIARVLHDIAVPPVILSAIAM
jgi:hypothetical protein